MASATSFGYANAGFQAGIINGNVDAAFHLPPERPETPPSPSIVIPFARDPDFVERGTTLDHVDQICTAPGAWAALVGLGGVGKSQLAIEHAYRTRERSPGTWVFWVHASNAARFKQSFHDIADRAKIAGRRDPQANIFKLVHDWLCDCKQRWLLILDNLDDAHFLFSSQVSGGSQDQTTNAQLVRKPLREYLPYCERGSIIVTTRNKDAALKLVEGRDVLDVEPMDEAQALALFGKKLEAQSDKSNVAELAVELEYIPLAIVQAAAYISRRAPLYSVAKYLKEFRKSDRKRLRLLAHDTSQLRRDWEAKSAIAVTWLISFEYIQQTQPAAADLLSLMSFFDRQGIPAALLQPQAERAAAQTGQTKADDDSDDEPEDDTSQSGAGDDEFEDAVAVLRDFYFISVDTTGTSFEMHALVQLAMRKWLEDNSKLERWKQQFVSNLHTAFPTGEYENWTACQALYAHAKAAVRHRPEDELSIAEWATVLYRAAWFAVETGNVSDAEMLAIKAMKARKKVLGQEHEDTLASIGIMGQLYRLEGQWNKAEKLQVEVVEKRKTKLGADHPDTLTSIGNLALTYSDQGQWDKAEKLQVQVVDASKLKLGAVHAGTLRSMNDLAATYWHRKRWDVAEKLFVQVVEARKTKLGADHPKTLKSINNLASTYRYQRRYDDAVKLDMEVMNISKTKLGVDHPDTLTSMSNLASTYSKKGWWDKAEALQVEVMKIRKTKLGVDHPDMLCSMNNLGSTYWNQERWDDAEKLQVQVVEITKTKFGVDHPHTLTSMDNLASIYRKQDRWDDAEKLEIQAMEARITKLRADRPDMLTSMFNLAFTWKAKGRNTEATALMRQWVPQRQ